jgi:hypothetical protein
MSSRQLRKQAHVNGAKAAGTKSPAGIQRSSVNALKHGLTSKAVVLSNESQSHFDELHLTYVREFEPKSGVEMDLVDQMVSAQWRLRRIWRMQTAALDLKMDQQEAEIAKAFHQIDQTTRTAVAFTAMANEAKALDLFLRYETAYTRMHQRAMNSLSKLRKEKLRNDPESTEPPASTSENVNCETTPPVESKPKIDPTGSSDPRPDASVGAVLTDHPADSPDRSSTC